MSGAYQDNNIVVAYTSERGEAQFGSDVVWGTHSGFRQDPGGTPFQINGHYTGGGDTRYLYYDGHPGYDFSTGGQNLPVYAAQSGTAHRGDLGLGEIYVDHGNGYTTHYLHLLVDGELVADNTPVDTTTQLGKAGGTGGFPVHLHFEVRYHGVPVDPYGWKGVGADPYTAMTNISLWSDTADQLVFVDIGPQAVDTPFQVTITARDRYGNIKTDFNSEVTLASSGAGAVNPISTHLTGGTATVTVTLSNPGTTSLTANGGGLSGKSKIFTVQGGNCQANITGRVIDLNNEAVTGATVSLYNNLALIDTVTTDLSGNYQFSHQPCGTYVLIFNKETDTQKSTTTTIYSNNQCAYLKTQLHLNAGTYGTPVILIPGILGSSQGYSRYPKLGEPQNKDKLTIHDPGRATGFRDLEDKLKEQGFTIFNCPWDWRLSPASAAEEYLKPKIEEALLKSTTGKVHIVAHSMGGLVARSLIQSSQELADKIGKFAMVGTPNLGSAHPYYIWEGGNPKMLDDIHDPGFFEVAPSFYERSLECLWEQTYGNKDWDALSYKKIKDFIQEKGPSLRDLMFTQKFLKNYSAENGVSLKNASPALTKLNSDPNRFRMSPDGVDNTIKTGLFLGKKQQTIRYITVTPQDAIMEQQGRWQDGQPKDDPKKTVVFGAGDGTVPEESARWPADDTSQGYTWARIVADYSDAKHSGLIGSYLTEITSFLESGEAPQGKVLIAAQATPLAASGTLNELTLSTRGTVRLDVVDPSGNHTGVLSATGEAAQQIPNSEMQFEMDSGGIKIENPVDGTYQVTIFGAANRDFQLDVGYGGSDFAEDKQLSGFMKSSTIAFDLIINTQTSPHLTVVPAVLPPETVQANPDTAGTNTIISWQLRPDADVTGYAIYSAGNTDPYFAQIGTVAATVASFQTSDLWAGSNAIAPKTYAVTALNNNGSESFLSVRVQNNDRDHDHLTDADEAAFGTDPTKPDTDDDTFSDYDEINAGSDPLLPSSVPAGSVKTLADAILYLRVLAGLHPDSGIAVEIDDINQDGRIGMEEVISTLRHLAQTP